MDKNSFEKFTNTLKQLNIEEYCFRADGGNRIYYNAKGMGVIFPWGDQLLCIQVSRNYGIEGNGYDIGSVEYDDIDSVRIIDQSFKDTIKFGEAAGVDMDKLKEFLKSDPVRQDIKPGTAGIDQRKDKDGNPVITPGRSGYLDYSAKNPFEK